MSYTPVTIPGFEQGLVQNMDPHLIPDDAQPTLVNAYQWRKRLIKKGGNRLLGEGRLGKRRLDMAFPGAVPATVDNAAIFGLTAVPIEPGTFVYFDGAATYTDTPTTMAAGVLTGVGGSSINYTTGVIAGFPALAAAGFATWIRKVDQYSPVMGLRIKESAAISNEELIAFDRRSAYSFNAITNVFDYIQNFKGTTNPVYWAGTNYEFFQSCNAFGALWVTNGKNGYYASATQIVISATEGGDPIRWYDGTGFVNFNPRFSVAGNYLQGAKFIIPFKSRLLVLNTWEGGADKTTAIPYRNRLRYSSLYQPYYSATVPVGITAPAGANAWYESPGNGGAFDFPTSEAITGVGYLQDKLIVFFERSTWLVADAGDRNAPFRYQKINTDFGCESPDSTITFDDAILAVGNTGIIGTSTSSTERIDQKIPDIAFSFHNENHGTERVHGIRNFMPQMAMWTYRESES